MSKSRADQIRNEAGVFCRPGAPHQSTRRADGGPSVRSSARARRRARHHEPRPARLRPAHVTRLHPGGAASRPNAGGVMKKKKSAVTIQQVLAEIDKELAEMR